MSGTAWMSISCVRLFVKKGRRAREVEREVDGIQCGLARARPKFEGHQQIHFVLQLPFDSF